MLAGTTNDGSCTFAVKGCTVTDAINYLPAGACTGALGARARMSGSALLVRTRQFLTDDSPAAATPYHPCRPRWWPSNVRSATVDDSSCVLGGCTLISASNYDSHADVNDGSCMLSVTGCTHSDAANYLPAATVDSGMCRFGGCTDLQSPDYTSLAVFDDGTCSDQAVAPPPPSSGAGVSTDGGSGDSTAATDDEDDDDDDYGGNGGPRDSPSTSTTQAVGEARNIGLFVGVGVGALALACTASGLFLWWYKRGRCSAARARSMTAGTLQSTVAARSRWGGKSFWGLAPPGVQDTTLVHVDRAARQVDDEAISRRYSTEA